MLSFAATSPDDHLPPVDEPVVNRVAQLPAVDERLVAENCGYEIFDGVLVPVSPAHEPHATRHLDVGALVKAHRDPAYEVALDMLTRVEELSDVAPDVSVYPYARDPETGGRQLEQLAFEIVSTESLAHAGRRATKLIARGVHRVFAIDVQHDRALEWSATSASWEPLARDAIIHHPALVVPLPVDVLLCVARSDDDVARALLAKRNAVLEAAKATDRAEGRAEGHAAGHLEGRAAGALAGKTGALLAALAARGIAVDSAARQQILDEHDLDRLDRWIVRAMSCTAISELFAER